MLTPAALRRMASRVETGAEGDKCGFCYAAVFPRHLSVPCELAHGKCFPHGAEVGASSGGSICSWQALQRRFCRLVFRTQPVGPLEHVFPVFFSPYVQQSHTPGSARALPHLPVFRYSHPQTISSQSWGISSPWSRGRRQLGSCSSSPSSPSQLSAAGNNDIISIYILFPRITKKRQCWHWNPPASNPLRGVISSEIFVSFDKESYYF